MAEKSLKIFFYVFDLIGPQNTCIGYGQTLLKRGHDVRFLVNPKYSGNFARFGLKEHVLILAPEPEERDPVKEVCDLIVNYKLFDDVETIEVLRRTMSFDFYSAFYDAWRAFQPQIKQIIEDEKPDLLIIDTDVAPPSLLFADVPFVYLFCSNPLGLLDSPNLPPFTSGLFFTLNCFTFHSKICLFKVFK